MANYTVIVVSRGCLVGSGEDRVRTSRAHHARSKAGVRWWLEHVTQEASKQYRHIQWDLHYARVWDGHYYLPPQQQPDWIVRNTRRGGIHWERNNESE